MLHNIFCHTIQSRVNFTDRNIRGQHVLQHVKDHFDADKFFVCKNFCLQIKDAVCKLAISISTPPTTPQEKLEQQQEKMDCCVAQAAILPASAVHCSSTTSSRNISNIGLTSPATKNTLEKSLSFISTNIPSPNVAPSRGSPQLCDKSNFTTQSLTRPPVKKQQMFKQLVFICCLQK